MLKDHPDVELAQYLLAGITEGFRIGFDHTHTCVSAKSNLLSAEQNPEVVRAYLQEEVDLGRVIGPLPKESSHGIHISPFGVIPKSGKPGKWRLIVDMSSPRGQSINNGISEELSSLSYISVDDVARVVALLGRNTLLAKVDIKSAYRMVLVHPQDRMLLGMEWQGSIYVDTCLPFGLRSAPRIFTALADAIEWGAQQLGVTWLLHYLDDYITLGAPGSQECAANIATFLELCRRLGVPIAMEKCEGPTTKLTYLGIEIDTVKMELRLPDKKLQLVRTEIQEWLSWDLANKKELESLVGVLQYATKVVRPGRRFVCRIIELMASVRNPRRPTRLNCEIRSDLQWWGQFIDRWNGVGLLPCPGRQTVHLETDASGNWGCAAVWGSDWLQWEWNNVASQWQIAPKELLPIVMASMVWGKEWTDKRVVCHCDNMAVVETLNGGYSKDALLMQLLRSLFFITEHYKCLIEAVHHPGKDNIRADALSRNNWHQFLQASGVVNQTKTRIPQELLDLLVNKQPDWTSPDWTQLFIACTRQV